MGLGKILACSSLIALSIVSPKEISAITCMPWNLSVEINGDGKLIKEKTERIPCNVDANYRKWKSKTTLMSHDMRKPILRIDYKSEESFYSEFWDGRNLISLLADRLYHFNH